MRPGGVLCLMELKQQQLEELIENFNKKLNPVLETALEATKKKVLQEKKKQFDTAGSNDWDSTPFPDVKDSTRARKISGGFNPDRTLYRTGELKDSLTESPDPYDIEIQSSGLKYADRQNKWASKRHSFLDLSSKEEEAALDYLEEQIIKSIQDAFK
jgi:hypothetical protein